MLDGEHRTVRENGDAKAGVVADAAQTQIPFAGRAPATDVGGRHWLSMRPVAACRALQKRTFVDFAKRAASGRFCPFAVPHPDRGHTRTNSLPLLGSTTYL